LPVLLAQAVSLARMERVEEAQDLLTYLTERGDPLFRARAYYNLGNLHLRRALAKVEAGDTNQAIVATTQAKDALRAALGLDPAHWDSKYNLEAALRLLPEMDRIGSGKDEEDAPDNPKRLWTSVPGFPRGQP
jgi:mxaK protein